MTNKIVADATAIVGAMSRGDQHFERASTLFERLPKPFLTCEPVITEVTFLLRKVPNGRLHVLDLLRNGVLRIDFSLADELQGVRSLIAKYDNVPMSLADGCLVRMSEIDDKAAILTFDQDFLIYRRHGSKKIPVIGLD